MNENLGIHHDKVKLYRYDEDVAIPNLSKLLPINRDLKPGLIIKWDKSVCRVSSHKEFSRIFRKHGWRVKGRGTMVYG